ncbi:hypothetical protein PanWU01x14_111630, partial [Parasponia andersonii]
MSYIEVSSPKNPLYVQQWSTPYRHQSVSEGNIVSRKDQSVPERTRVFPKEPECPRRNDITYLGASLPHPIQQYSSGNINTPR